MAQISWVWHIYSYNYIEWCEDVQYHVVDVERGPGDEEDDADGDQEAIGLLPASQLANGSGSGDGRDGGGEV